MGNTIIENYDYILNNLDNFIYQIPKEKALEILKEMRMVLANYNIEPLQQIKRR